MADDGRTGVSATVVVALIGLVGVLGAAAINNSDKLFGREIGPAAATHTDQQPVVTTRTDDQAPKPAATDSAAGGSTATSSAATPAPPPTATSPVATGSTDTVPAHTASAPAGEDCIPFDWSTATASQAGGRWKLVQGGMWMLDFGNNQTQAAMSQQVVRSYKLRFQCFVGRGKPAVEYYLDAGAKLPTGPMPGEDCLDLDPATVQARPTGDHWTIINKGSEYAFTAPNQELANKAIAIIQKYGATKSCFVGRPNPGMRYLRQ